MYYYPRIPKSFSPAPFSHKLYDNSTIERVFHPTTTPQLSSPVNKRRRSFSVVQKTQDRSLSRTKHFEENSVEKTRSRHNDSNKYFKSTDRVSVHYINNGSNKTPSSSNHKTIQITLEEYFEKIYFSKLSGLPHKQLNQKLQPYIKEIILLDQQNSQIADNWIPLEFQGINTKEKLLSAIKKLEKLNRKQFVKELIVYYCVPSQKTRTALLLGLIADIHIRIREKMFLDYSFTSYCLVSNKGKIINDILKLSMLTSEMIFCEKSSHRESYMRFKEMKSKREVDGYQNNLLELVKTSFRDRVKNIDQDQQPEKIKRFEKKLFEEAKSVVTRRKKLAPEYKHLKTKKNQKQTSVMELKEEYQISNRQALEFVDEFQSLIGTNSRYPESERIPIEIKTSEVLFSNFKQNCISLQGKQKENISNILSCMEFPQLQTVTLKRYVQFRLVVKCLAEPPKVLQFLIKYLRLDTEKQLTKQMLMESFKLTLREYKIPRSNRVIIDILWLQFKRTNLIQYVQDEQYLTINRFKENYLLNKTVYYLIMTIIFCTNDPIDSVYQVLN